MIGIADVAPGLVIIGVATATAAFLLRGPPDKPTLYTASDDLEEDSSRGVLGLQSLDRASAAGSGVTGFGSGAPGREEPLAAAGATAAAPVAPGEFVMEEDEDAAGARRVSPRLAEELAWACAEVGDCGTGGVAVFDAEGELLWTDGEMVDAAPEDREGGDFVRRVRDAGKKIVAKGDQVFDLPPCFLGEVGTLVGIPIGDGGSVMVIASKDESFYGALQDRVCSAVVERLQLFFFTDTFKNIG